MRQGGELGVSALTGDVGQVAGRTPLRCRSPASRGRHRARSAGCACTSSSRRARRVRRVPTASTSAPRGPCAQCRAQRRVAAPDHRRTVRRLHLRPEYIAACSWVQTACLGLSHAAGGGTEQAGADDLLNVPFEPFAGRRGTLDTPHVANVPRSAADGSSGTLRTGPLRRISGLSANPLNPGRARLVPTGSGLVLCWR